MLGIALCIIFRMLVNTRGHSLLQWVADLDYMFIDFCYEEIYLLVLDVHTYLTYYDLHLCGK